MPDMLVLILIIIGLTFYTGGAVGIVRMPDFYSRLHPAGKLDTAGLAVTMLALALYCAAPLSLSAILTAAKIILIVVFVFLTSPTATHAIVDAGVRAGLEPWRREDILTSDDLAD